MQRSDNLDEVCYPFIHEHGPLTDFEVITDELCGNIGAAVSLTPAEFADIHQDLATLQPLAFHLNGSLRGRMAIEEADIKWAKARLDHYRNEAKGQATGFVLPRGEMPVPFLNLARSGAKKAIRQLVRIEETGQDIPDVLPRLCNVFCNLFFAMILVINQRRGLSEEAFVSKSYGANTRKG
ncbi:ATP--cob(I)alamin adenosyltransferase [Spiribacter sp. C176]|uniref:ATP--cob(I)alamin adenosyltransferase n=1 Tax=Spiribacter salilacus TaxID=2664894 RepID=A0A6N7QNP9_9GAMM|nr:ATP--cob(I)alamin adenosyltransferase [Spiribacter salilacus]MRH78145.1 ATP--cob(I)alamin adenosyltransferase [Spiribacter salilacus]